MKKIVALILLACSLSQANYFLDMPTETKKDVRPLPFFRGGGSVSVAYYLNSLDLGLNLSGEFRLHKHHSLDLFGGLLFSGRFYELGATYRFFFTGSLMENFHDDYLLVAVSDLPMKKNDELYFPPRLSLGYGRDFLFLENSNVVCRAQIRFGYNFGETISKKSEQLIIARETSFVVYVDFGVLFF